MTLEDLIEAFNKLKQLFEDHSHTGTDSQTIAAASTTLTGDVTGSGTGSIGTTIAAGAVTEAKMTTADNTTNNVSSTKHGFAPKSPGDATKYLNGAATPAYAQVQDSDIGFTDISTGNSATNQHGFLKKLDNNSAHFMNGVGSWALPSGGVTLVQSGSNITIANTTAKTDVFTYTVPANTLGTSKGYRVKLWVSNIKNATNSVDLTFFYGATGSDINLGSQNLNRPGVWDCSLIADGATNAQRVAQSFIAVAVGITQGSNLNFGVDTGTTATDSTASQTLKCSVQFGSATANDTITIAHYTLELLT